MKKPLQPPLIRIIDDDAQALEAVDFMLKCEGYSTVAYSSAAEFLVDIFTRHDIIFLIDSFTIFQ